MWQVCQYTFGICADWSARIMFSVSGSAHAGCRREISCWGQNWEMTSRPRDWVQEGRSVTVSTWTYTTNAWDKSHILSYIRLNFPTFLWSLFKATSLRQRAGRVHDSSRWKSQASVSNSKWIEYNPLSSHSSASLQTIQLLQAVPHDGLK